MNDFEAWNRQVIEEFHANEGKVNGSDSLLLLRTTGARSGKQRVNPLAYTMAPFLGHVPTSKYYQASISSLV